jgi:hypothetical protein
MNKVIAIVFSCFFVAFASVGTVAFAQDAKPAEKAADKPADKASAEKPLDMPKHSCKKPENPGKLASERQQAQFRKDIDSYRDCLTAFREQMNRQAKVYVEAANGAIQEFNDYVTELNASVKK